jgi:peptidylprolyl isomerase
MKTLTTLFAAFVLAACAHPTDIATDSTTATAATTAAASTPAAEAPKGPEMDTFSIPTNLQTTPTGLKYSVDQEGTGAQAFIGQTVSVYYTGWLENGTEFDSSRRRGRPLEFPLGMNRVIKGWEEGIAGMKVGEKRTLVIPASLGYGSRGMGGVIPPDATLIFKVELMGTK